VPVRARRRQGPRACYRAPPEEHETGYRFTQDATSSGSLSVTFRQDGTLAQGFLRSKSTAGTAWTESDDWEDAAADTVGTTGQIPAPTWLVFEDQQGNERPQATAYDEDECDGGTCELTVSDTCTLAIAFDAVKSDFTEEDAYAHLADVGQGAL
jgi:hypothetical protein